MNLSRITLLNTTLAAAACLALGSLATAGVFHPDGATTLHFAFEGSPNGDRPIIRPPAYYRADDGFGFVDSPELRGTSWGVTAAKYFRFDVNIPPGTYDVTVKVGGTAAESLTTIKAEGQPTPVQALKSQGRQGVDTPTFTVTVKPATPGSTSMATDGRLSLEFSGTNPSMMKLDIKPAAKAE